MNVPSVILVDDAPNVVLNECDDPMYDEAIMN